MLALNLLIFSFMNSLGSLSISYANDTPRTLLQPQVQRDSTQGTASPPSSFSSGTNWQNPRCLSGWIPSLQLFGIRKVCTNKKIKLCASQTMFLPRIRELDFNLPASLV